MGRRAIQLPSKTCEFCGTSFNRKRHSNGKLEASTHYNRRKFCSLGCAAKHNGQAQRRPVVGWGRLGRLLLEPGSCVRCGSPKGEVHHKDENWQNNRAENLERLCRSCHMKEHNPSAPCTVGGCPNTVTWTNGKRNIGGRGMCSKHYQRWKKWGDPLVVKVNQHTPAVRVDE
jgi:hypothetical protein